MELHMQETINECLEKIKNSWYSGDLHHGELMYLGGYAAALMHARAISVEEFNTICRLRDKADEYWKEHKK